ncbi:MAG: alpha-L-arabinofuranosidase C-terminal domain-containing protein [Bacteroidota bacterium]
MKKHLAVIACCLLLHVLRAQQAIVSLSDTGGTVISKLIYGHFAEHLGRCIYDGFYRNGKIRMDIVSALKKIQVPVLRWPGGCFADQYHWKDGIGDKSKRPVRINANWGMVKEDNSFGTDEYLQLCKLLSAEPYIAGNVGTGSPQELKDWVEYLNYQKKRNVSFVGIGNESWDCGGNMNAQFYSDQYKQFASFLPDYSGTRLKKIAVGPYKEDYQWTETVMKNIPSDKLWGLSLHYYVFMDGFGRKGSATEFSETEYFLSMKKTLFIDELISKHSAIMDKYDPQKKVALVVDEWGIWTDVEKGTNPDFLFQQNSLRDALIAATTLNIFNNHADRVKMANLAQTVNVLQALILTKGDSMLLTPTYYVFDMFKVHQDAKLLPLHIATPFYENANESVAAVSGSASMDSSGVTHITLVNIDAGKDVPVLLGNLHYTRIEGRILSSGSLNDINTFSNPSHLAAKDWKGFEKKENGTTVILPAKSVCLLTAFPK